MSILALALVLTGALCHTLWNLAAKRASGGLVFVWLFGMVSTMVAIPVTLWAWQSSPQLFDGMMWLAVLASGLIHVAYSLVLQRAYQESEFSVVYPVARGGGPMLSVLAAIVLLGEHPSLTGIFSILAILLGLFVSAGVLDFSQEKASSRRMTGVLWGMATALFIASYTSVDAWAIKSLGMVPVLFYAAGLAFRSLFLTPFVLGRKEEISFQIKMYWKEIMMVGILSPLAYLLVLTALQFAPLSYVAPVREVSMLVGLVIGVVVLKEEIKATQAIGALIMLGGVIGLVWA